MENLLKNVPDVAGFGELKFGDRLEEREIPFIWGDDVGVGTGFCLIHRLMCCLRVYVFNFLYFFSLSVLLLAHIVVHIATKPNPYWTSQFLLVPPSSLNALLVPPSSLNALLVPPSSINAPQNRICTNSCYGSIRICTNKREIFSSGIVSIKRFQVLPNDDRSEGAVRVGGIGGVDAMMLRRTRTKRTIIGDRRCFRGVTT